MTRFVLYSIAAFAFCICPHVALAQAEGSDRQQLSHDLSSLQTKMENYSHDFQEIATALPTENEGSQAAVFYRDMALGMSYNVYAANTMLQMYDNLTCSGDRERVKPILDRSLHIYAGKVDTEVDRISGFTSLVKNTEVVQLALKMKDDYRSLSQSLEIIAAQLR